MSQIPNNNIQLTQEEIDKRLNKFYVDDDYVNQVFSPEASPQMRKQLLQRLVDGSAKYATTVNSAVLDHRMAELQAKHDEIARLTHELYRERMFNKLYDKHGTLKEYPQIVQDSVHALGNREDLPTDESALLDLINQEAVGRIKLFKPDYAEVPDETGKKGGGSSPQSQQQQTIVPASTDAGGYQGGTARSGGASPVAAGRAEPGLWDD